MAAGTLYTYPDNFRAQKALLAAEYSGAKVRLARDFVFGETNASADFKAKFPSGKVPAYESDDGEVLLTESSAIAYYLSNEQLKGTDPVLKAQVLQWTSWADSDLYNASCAWTYPIMGLVEADSPAMARGKQATLECLAYLDRHLLTRTFLVGERITLADIVVFCNFLNVIRYALDKNLGKKFFNACRWFNTMLNQPEVIKVVKTNIKLFEIGNLPSMPEKLRPKSESEQKPAQKPAQKSAQKPEKKAAPPKDAAEDDGEDDFPKEPPSKNPFDAMPKGTFDMEAFKRVYSNEAESVSIPYFFEKFDPQNYSVWLGEYKYNDELTKVFMSCNLITGMFQRLDKMRKASFASCCLFGQDNNSSISGVWVWRGHELAFPQSPDWQIDYESYNWTKLDYAKPETKSLIEQYFSWTGKDKQGRDFNQGKIFK